MYLMGACLGPAAGRGAGGGLLSDAAIALLADAVRARAFGQGAVGLAAGAGLTILIDELPPGQKSSVDDGLVAIRPQPTPAAQEMAILREVAGAVLLAVGVEHAVPDVGALAEALAAG